MEDVQQMKHGMYRQIDLYTFPDGTCVSTVFLGKDYVGEGPPMIWDSLRFETLILGPLADGDKPLHWRHPTEDLARRWHRSLVEIIDLGGGVVELSGLRQPMDFLFREDAK